MNKKTQKSYANVWRWHFYAGMFIAPFLIVLALTGLGMMLFAYLDGRDGERIQVSVPSEKIVQPVSIQAKSAIDVVKDGQLKQYIAPRDTNLVSIFRVDGEEAFYVAVNPYNAEVVKVYPRHDDIYHLLDNIHGDLLIGKVGDLMLEASASLAILMIVTGWYLWWLRQKTLSDSLFPKLRSLANKKIWWRNAHGVTGAWVSVVLLLFLLSGLAWAGIWGGKIVQPWNQFPEQKWSNVPKSELTHGEVLNEGATKEVPWALELTSMPVSDKEGKLAPSFDAKALANLDVIDRYARENGFEGRYQMHLPKGETGVWTLSQDSMSYDSNNPFSDRIVHLDQYSGNQLAEARFNDYNIIGKAMAVGIALHMGTLGWWSILANAIICLAIIFMCIGGYVMWWKRRPSKLSEQPIGLNPPPAQSIRFVNKGLIVLLLVLSALFPIGMLTIIAIVVLDFLLFSRVNILTKWLK